MPLPALTLAREMTASGRIALVDLRDDGLSKESGLETQPGLAELMADKVGFAEAIHRDRSSTLHVVPAGVSTDDDVASAANLTVFLQALARSYDAVLIDAGVIDSAVETRPLVSEADVTLVVRGGADADTMAAALEQVAAAKPSMLLAVEPAANDDPAPANTVAA